VDRTHRILATATAGALLAVACTKVPYTNRKQFNAIPESTTSQLGAQTYASMLEQGEPVPDGDDADVLERVGGRIASVANEPGYDWDFTLLRDDTANAWALPGGKVGFHTGILPILRQEAGMAFVIEFKPPYHIGVNTTGD
jgi:predicted Zn-dependent protease